MTAIVIRKAYADTPHGQLHYRYFEAESPKDILIFLHKSASSSASYNQLITHYAGLGYACYAPDMPGFGNSFDPSDAAIEEINAKNTRWYVDLYMDFFKSLGVVDKRFHVVGHHSGASLAAEMAAVYPDAVKSICLVGASVMSASDRANMKTRFFAPFNKPVSDGSHLTKTWDYLQGMGVGDDIDRHQNEAIDHIRAWKGRNQIYGAIWNQDKEKYFSMVKCPVVALCAKDDVLWPYFENVGKIRPDVPMVEVKGANFTLQRDPEGVIKEWTPLIEKST